MSYINPRHKILWYTEQLAAVKREETPPPINVEIDLSNRCSLGCEWCHFAYTHTRGPLANKRDKPAGAVPGGDLMDRELALDILDQLADAGVQSVTWTGGGEPTLHPNFDEIVEYAYESGLAQGIYTHGGHISRGRASLLRRTHTWVYVSLDECMRKTYQMRKGVDRFDNALDGIRRLVKAGGRATVGVGFLLHDKNAYQVHTMVRLGLEQVKADYVHFRPVVLYEQDNPGVLIESAEWVDEALAHLSGYDDERVLYDRERFTMYRDWDGHGYDACYWTALQTVITPGGQVWRCVNKRERPGALMGNLNEEPFKHLWERAGGPCDVNDTCRIMCRGHMANLTLQAVMEAPPHKDFI